MQRIISNDKVFNSYEYKRETDFEKEVINHSKNIFGKKSVYIDIKKRIGEDKILSIPDGYLIDFSFEKSPKLYIIENELVSHDPFRHIGQQLLKFAISYKASGRKIRKLLLEDILNDQSKKNIVDKGVKKAGFRNIDDLLDNIIFEKDIIAVVIIDEITSDLQNVLSQLTMKTDVIEFKTFYCNDEKIFQFTPFQQDILEITEEKKSVLNLEEIDTIVVPANEEGFNKEFIENDCWWAIRISSSMLDRIKFIAAYQTSPVSAITHLAEVSKIEKYKDTGKYKIYFKEAAKKVGPIRLTSRKKGTAPQAPRYTSLKKLKKAKKFEDVF